MNVAEIYVAVLRAQRVADVNVSRATSLAGHARDVENRFGKGMASRNDLLAVQVSLADAQQRTLQARNSVAMLSAAYNRALRRSLSDAVRLVDLPPSGDLGNLDDLTGIACAGQPEIAALSAQARTLSANPTRSAQARPADFRQRRLSLSGRQVR